MSLVPRLVSLSALVIAGLTTTCLAEDVPSQEAAPVIIAADPSQQNPSPQNSEQFGQVLDNLPYAERPSQLDDYSVPSAEGLRPRTIDVTPYNWGLVTQSGLSASLQVSNYHYHEPSLAVTLLGLKGGTDIELTEKLDDQFFLKEDGRLSVGASDYSGSGTSSGKFERLIDIRAMGGRDFIITNSYALAPTLGFGFRDLYSDDRGVSSTGAGGYRRSNDLLYVPVGLTQRFLVDTYHRVSATAEFDYVIQGQQTSHINDVDTGAPTLVNLQHNGRGVRGEIMWETPRWSFGPFANYWNIDQSTTRTACGTNLCFTGYEPHNWTLEMGAQLKYHFIDF